MIVSSNELWQEHMMRSYVFLLNINTCCTTGIDITLRHHGHEQPGSWLLVERRKFKHIFLNRIYFWSIYFWLTTDNHQHWFMVQKKLSNCLRSVTPNTNANSQTAKFMGPKWGPPGSCRPQMGPCWPHEHCYQGLYAKLTSCYECLHNTGVRHLY